VVTTLVVTSIVADISIGRQNLAFGSIRLDNTPEIQAARWIESHTAPNAIISSRLTPLVYHYSRRRVIWFPPITNPEILMQGVRKHHIQYVVVVDRKFSYYLPPDVVCFDLLYTAYPLGFRLVEMKGQLRIYEVLQGSTALALQKQTDSS
jgi:hypothetical protein